MAKWIHDIETYPNFFCVGLLNYTTKEYKVFEFSDRKNDLPELRKFYNSEKGYLIGFNSKGYDDIVINYLLKTKNVTNSKLKAFSDQVISDNYEEFRKFKYPKWKFDQVDLACYWPKSQRLSKQLSLKFFGVVLKHHKLQELPYHHTTELTSEQMDKVIAYNINDLEITEKLTKALSKQINFRLDYKKKFGVSFMSTDSVRIGFKTLMDDYCKEAGVEYEDIKHLRSNRDKFVLSEIILDNIKFNGDITEPYLTKDKKGEPIWIAKNFNSLLHHLKQRVVYNTSELSYWVYLDDKVYSIKSGGLHTIHSAEIVEVKEGHIYEDVDVSSYYPSLGEGYGFVPEHLGTHMKNVIGKNKRERIEYKKQGLTLEAEIGKLKLNGGYYGNLALDIPNNPMFDPLQTFKITINGQLFLLMLAEWFIEAGIKIDSCNTDGITYMCNESQYPKAKELIKKWEEMTGFEMEAVRFKKVIRMTGNDYMAIPLDEKKAPKLKGITFKIPSIEQGDSVDQLVVKYAVIDYFLKGTPVSTFIKNHKDIYDFCLSPRINHGYQVTYNNQVQQNLNRFYASTDGYFIYKKRKQAIQKKGQKKVTIPKEENIFLDSRVTLFNDYFDSDDYKINYSYYIGEAMKIIHKLETPKLL